MMTRRSLQILLASAAFGLLFGAGAGGRKLRAAAGPGGGEALASAAPALPRADSAPQALEAAMTGLKGVKVLLRPSARIEGETFTLADIAEFQGEDYELIGLLAQLSMGTAPMGGAPARLPRSRVAYAIEQAAPGAADIQVEGAEEVRVERQTMRIDMALLREELSERVKSQLPFDPQQVSVSQIHLPEDISLPKGRLKLDVEFQFPKQLLGQTSFITYFNVDNRLARRLNGTMTVDMAATALQAVRMVMRGERLRPEDFHQVAWSRSRLPRNALSSLPSAQTNAAAKDNIQPGEILTDGMVERPALVNRNDAVTLVIRRGPLCVTATAKAKESGGAGEVIRAVNLQSQKEIFARVIDSQTAEVIY